VDDAGDADCVDTASSPTTSKGHSSRFCMSHMYMRCMHGETNMGNDEITPRSCANQRPHRRGNTSSHRESPVTGDCMFRPSAEYGETNTVSAGRVCVVRCGACPRCRTTRRNHRSSDAVTHVQAQEGPTAACCNGEGACHPSGLPMTPASARKVASRLRRGPHVIGAATACFLGLRRGSGWSCALVGFEHAHIACGHARCGKEPHASVGMIASPTRQPGAKGMPGAYGRVTVASSHPSYWLYAPPAGFQTHGGSLFAPACRHGAPPIGSIRLV
jgi:hypothetical protein